MTTSAALVYKQVFAPTTSGDLAALGSMATEILTNAHQLEILAFLAVRPLHTVIMAGHIRDNGVVSALNRGAFHGYRGLDGSLEGVALIGHATLMEARSLSALQAFARMAHNSSDIHVIMAEQEKADLFWDYYSQAGTPARVPRREMLLEQRWPVGVTQIVSELRQATMDDLEVVMLVQSEIARTESGVDPATTDPAGFRQRCARRIALGRTWIWREGQRLIFKVDIVAYTPGAIYLEGVWVNPTERGKNYGFRCITQVSRKLLKQTDSLCVLVHENNLKAHKFYRRAGFKPRGSFQTVYLRSNAGA